MHQQQAESLLTGGVPGQQQRDLETSRDRSRSSLRG